MKRSRTDIEVPCFCKLCNGKLVSRYFRRKHSQSFVKVARISLPSQVPSSEVQNHGTTKDASSTDFEFETSSVPTEPTTVTEDNKDSEQFEGPLITTPAECSISTDKDNKDSEQFEEPLITTPAECSTSTDKDQDSDDHTGSLEVSFFYRYAMPNCFFLLTCSYQMTTMQNKAGFTHLA